MWKIAVLICFVGMIIYLFYFALAFKKNNSLLSTLFFFAGLFFIALTISVSANLTEEEWTTFDGSVNITNNGTYGGNVTGENVWIPTYLFAHTDNNISVATGGYWYNVTFDDGESFKQRINHTYNDSTNDTFIIAYGGVHMFHYAASFEDTAPSPDGHIEIRLVRNDIEINGSLLEEDSSKQYSTFTINNGPILELDVGDKIKFQFTADDTTIKLASHNIYGVHKDTATMKIIRIA